jgi:hypothetical protein
MNIKDKFIELTKKTYPHGSEEEVFSLLGRSLEKDEFGNLFIQVGESDVMFTSHLDTATSQKTSVKHVFEGDFIKTDGTSILGADDKAGVTIMLYMIENNIPGLYYFFIGEEVGCIGSRKVSTKHKSQKIENITKVISFDRRGTGSVITFQAGSRCCSNEFGSALAKMLNDAEPTFKYENDPTGVYTDSAQFVSIYPECTNISVGYYSEHTYNERQDIVHLEKLANACLKVDWTSLPVVRDPSKYESRYNNYYSGGTYSSVYNYSSRYYDTDDEDYYPASNSTIMNKYHTLEKEYIYDSKYGHVSTVEYNKYTKIIVNISLHEDRIKEETCVVTNFLNSIEVDFKSLKWDGKKATISTNAGLVYVTREEIAEYLEEFSLEKMSEYLDPEDISMCFNKIEDM